MRFHVLPYFLLCLGLVSVGRADLISHWRLDETSGAIASNEITGAPAGTVGGALVWASGPRDGAAEFNGTDTHIYIPSSLGSSGNWTWAMWLRYDSLTTVDYDSILSTNDWAVGTGMHCILRNTGAFTVALYTGGPDEQPSQSTLAPGVWHHIAWTYDAAAAESKFYINGKLDVTRAVNVPIPMTLGQSTLGAWNAFGSGYQRWLDGGIDDVRIYNETLTAADIEALYLGPTCATYPSPDLDELDVAASALLSWTAPINFPSGATYDVYFTSNPDDVPNALPLVSNNQSETTFDPVLTIGRPYWWRIDVHDPSGQTTYTGAVWHFTTLGIQITESDGSTVVYEGGASDSYEMVLPQQPAAGTTVNVAAIPSNAQIKLNSGSAGQTITMVFDDQNWQTPQTVHVIAVDDKILHLISDVSISHYVSSDDPVYNWGALPAALTVDCHDDDSCGLWGYNRMDFNRDCVVNLEDFALFARDWLVSIE